MLVEPFIPFLLFFFAMFATPGPNTLSIAASGAAFGLKKSLLYIFGIIFGIVIIFIVTASGLAYVFKEYPLVKITFEWISLTYILFLSYKIATADTSATIHSKNLDFMQGILLSILNPKAYFAIIATVSQFLNSTENYLEDLLILIFWVVILLVITNITWATVGSVIRPEPGSQKAKIMNIFFALLLAISVLATMMAT